MVLLGMWHCANCQYVNDDRDEECARCGTRRGATPATRQAAASSPARQRSPADQRSITAGKAEKPTSPPRTKAQRVIELFAWLVILASVAGIVFVLYLAWQRGVLPWPPSRQSTLTLTEASAPTAPAQLVEDPLRDLAESNERSLAPFKRVISSLFEIRAELDPILITIETPGTLSADTLGLLKELNQQGTRLLQLYQDFEQLCQQHNKPELIEPQQVISVSFSAAFEKLLDLIAQAYSQDCGGAHEAYLLSDQIPAVLEQYGQPEAVLLRERWAEAIYARKQTQLDIKYEDEYRHLAAFIAALDEVHQQFSVALREVPPYRIRSGKLGKDAATVIELYDSLAAATEQIVAQYEEYVATLDPLDYSDRMKEYFKEFEDYAKESHLSCFTEIYMIYAKDKHLDHPVYENLKAHYEFAREYWSESELAYRQTYIYYERLWEQSWLDR